MRKPHSWLIVVMAVVCSLSLNNLHSQEYPDYNVRIVAIPNNVAVGDLIEITVEILHKDNIIFTITEPVLPSGVDIVSSEDQIGIFDRMSDRLVSIRTFKIALYTLDLQDRGYIDLLWIDSKLITGTIRVELPQINIYQTRHQDDWSLRPLFPLFDQENFYSLDYQKFLVISVLAIFIVYLGRKVRKQSKQGNGILKRYDEDIAKNQLSLLRDVSLEFVQDYRKFYQSIDRIIRQYISSRYEMQTSSLTVKELIIQAEFSQVNNWQLRLISDLLNRCDEVIYGNIFPDPILADRDLTIAYEIIELNRGSISDETVTKDLEHEI